MKKKNCINDIGAGGAIVFGFFGIIFISVLYILGIAFINKYGGNPQLDRHPEVQKEAIINGVELDSK